MKRYTVTGIISALFLAELTASFETGMIFSAMSKLIAEFGDPIAVGWLVTIYLLVAAGAAAVAGRLGDIFGRRLVVVILLGAATVGSIISALTTEFSLVLFGRGLQGLAAAIIPLCFGIIRENLSKKMTPIAIGITVAAANAGTAAGLIIGGVIVDNFNWRGIFIAAAILGFLSVLAIQFLVPKSRLVQIPEKLDFLGGILFVPAIGALLLSLSKLKTWGWEDPKTISLLLGGLVLLGLWIRQSLRHENPLLNVRLFANRQVAVTNLVAVFLAMSGMQVTLIVSMLLQSPVWTGVGLGISSTLSGLMKLPSNIGGLVVGPLSGFVSSKYGHRRAMLIGALIGTIGWAVITFSHDNAILIVGILCIISWGTTFLYAATPNAIVDAVPMDRTSEATGMLIVVRSAFYAIGAQISAVVLATDVITHPTHPGEYPTEHAITLTFGVITLFAAMAVVFSLFLPNKASQTSDEGSEKVSDLQTTPVSGAPEANLASNNKPSVNHQKSP